MRFPSPPHRPAFRFGAYQGSPFTAEASQVGGAYAGQRAYSAGRDAGFDLATILPAWGWVTPYMHDETTLENTFGHVGLDWKKYVVQDPALIRPAEADLLVGDAAKARRVLGWKPKVDFRGLVHMMVEADLQRLRK